MQSDDPSSFPKTQPKQAKAKATPAPQAPVSPELVRQFPVGHTFTVNFTVTSKADVAKLLACATAEDKNSALFNGFKVESVFTNDVTGSRDQLVNLRLQLLRIAGLDV